MTELAAECLPFERRTMQIQLYGICGIRFTGLVNKYTSQYPRQNIRIHTGNPYRIFYSLAEYFIAGIIRNAIVIFVLCSYS